jgi:hypothetical protein
MREERDSVPVNVSVSVLGVLYEEKLEFLSYLESMTVTWYQHLNHWTLLLTHFY